MQPDSIILNQDSLPTVSVIVPIYNGELDVPELVGCLSNQTYPPDRVEYLLVDNNSRDRTADVIKTSIETIKNKGLSCHYLSQTQLQSSYATRNRGIRVSTGEILAFTDADCRPQPRWLEALIEPFNNARIGLVAGSINPVLGNTLLEQYAIRKNILSHKNALVHPFCPFGKTANLAVRRQVLQEVGLFRSHLTTGGDADFCWRIQRQTAWQFQFAEKAIVQHRHRTNLPALLKQFRRYGRSHRYLHELHGVDLREELKFYQYGYRLSRWLVKELPLTGINLFRKKGKLVDLIVPPIYLLTVRAEMQGQREAVLPEQARQLEWL